MSPEQHGRHRHLMRPPYFIGTILMLPSIRSNRWFLSSFRASRRNEPITTTTSSSEVVRGAQETSRGTDGEQASGRGRGRDLKALHRPRFAHCSAATFHFLTQHLRLPSSVATLSLLPSNHGTRPNKTLEYYVVTIGGARNEKHWMHQSDRAMEAQYRQVILTARLFCRPRGMQTGCLR
jgi:hypothetical protein